MNYSRIILYDEKSIMVLLLLLFFPTCIYDAIQMGNIVANIFMVAMLCIGILYVFCTPVKTKTIVLNNHTEIFYGSQQMEQN